MAPINKFLTTTQKTLSARRLVLLGTASALGAALLLAAPASQGAMNLRLTSLAQAADAEQPPASFAKLVAQVKPAVISVRVKISQAADTPNMDQNDSTLPFGPGSPFYRFFRGFPNAPNGVQGRQVITGEGSGFFISADGYAVTNYHVVDHAKSVKVTTDDGSIYTAKVIGTDPKTDLALIKVDAHKDFTFVKFSDQMPRVGDWVVAVGNPFGLGGTVTAGIVSARGRDIGSNPYDDYMQIDAPINKGNSGGPTFNLNGDVVGINTAIYSPSGGSVGIGFDIPATLATTVIAQLKNTGYVTRGQMGVEIQSVTAGIADSLGMKKAEGTIVDRTQPGSPAAKAGIQTGDVITAVNGTAVKDSGDLARTISMMAPGSSAKLDILHQGETKVVTVTLARQPDARQASASDEQTTGSSSVSHFGLTLAPANEVAGSGDKGVAVVGIDPDGTAADHGLQTGDVILDVGGKPVTTAGDVREALTEAHAQGKHDILMRVKTANATKFIALPLRNG